MPAEAPARFPELADVGQSILAVGGDFVVAEVDARIAGMGGIRPNNPRQAEVVYVRVHPALRIGTAVMSALERRAADLGFEEMHLDTATNQPEALAFYRALGYHALTQETRPEWQWTLQYFTKRLLRDSTNT